jgi:hypothetical protein
MTMWVNHPQIGDVLLLNNRLLEESTFTLSNIKKTGSSASVEL